MRVTAAAQGIEMMPPEWPEFCMQLATRESVVCAAKH
jgi:hypothetical protein